MTTLLERFKSFLSNSNARVEKLEKNNYELSGKLHKLNLEHKSLKKTHAELEKNYKELHDGLEKALGDAEGVLNKTPDSDPGSTKAK